MSRKRSVDGTLPPEESIGRPGPWREGRYHKGNAPPGDSVVRRPGEVAPDRRSMPVTRKDYEQGD